MPRKNNNSELWDAISEVGVGRNLATGASTTLSVATLAGAASFSVASSTSLAAGGGDILRIGSGSDSEICVTASVAGTSVTPKYPLTFAHNAADVVIAQAKTVLGVVDDNGVSVDITGQFNEVYGASRRQVYAYAGGHWAPKIDFAIENVSMENILASLGIPESNVGTAGSQYRAVAAASLFGTQLDQWFYFVGVKHDQLTNLEIRLWACELDWSQALKAKYKRGDSQAASVAFSVRPVSAIEFLLG